MKFILIISFFLISCSGTTTYFYSLSDEVSENIASSKVEPPQEIIAEPSEEIVVEEFALRVPDKNPLDILIIVDSSESMFHHLDKLGKSLNHLLSVISHFDWQIGFTTVYHGDKSTKVQKQDSWEEDYKSLKKKNPGFGRLFNLDSPSGILSEKILTKRTRNYEKVFSHTLSHVGKIDCKRPPFCSPALEQPLRSLKSAIERSHYDNRAFFRPNANLVSLIVTNEDERKEDPSRATRATDVIKSFKMNFSDKNKKYLNFNILIKDLNCLERENKRSKYSWFGNSLGTFAPVLGHIVSELADLTGGTNIDICDSDYGPNLELISQKIRSTIDNNFELSYRPIGDKVSISFDGQPNSSLSWSLEGQKLIFKGPLKQNRKVKIRYKVRK